MKLSELRDDFNDFDTSIWTVNNGSASDITPVPPTPTMGGGLRINSSSSTGTIIETISAYDFDDASFTISDLAYSTDGFGGWFQLTDEDAWSSLTVSVDSATGTPTVSFSIQTADYGTSGSFPYEGQEAKTWRAEYIAGSGILNLYASAATKGRWGPPLASYQLEFPYPVKLTIGSPPSSGSMTIRSLNTDRFSRRQASWVGAVAGEGIADGWPDVMSDSLESRCRFSNRTFEYPDPETAAYWRANRQESGSLDPVDLPTLHEL